MIINNFEVKSYEGFMMDASMNDIISKKHIKPFTVTPSPLRVFKLSSMDQLLDDVYVPVYFLFSSQQNNSLSRTQMSQKLEDSLSKTLTYYFPFAGRLIDNEFIYCNDDGVLFLEVQIKSTMCKTVEYPDVEDLVFPQGLPWGKSSEGHLAVFQLSYFNCGGMAISACISHKVADVSTATTFINDWALMARQSGHVPSPHFVGKSIFPPVDDPPPKLAEFSKGTNVVTRIFVFNSSKISQLKFIADDSGVEKPTRVEVVVALLLNRVMSVVRSRLNSFQPSLLFQVINLRPLIIPPMPENSVGNLALNFFISASEENEMEFSGLVSKSRDEKIKFKNQYKVELEANDFSLDITALFRDREKQYRNNNFDLYHCSSLCGFPLYQIDFGWGRPSRVCIATYPEKNRFWLMDTPSGDGIEAMVTLEEQVMSMFECDAELLEFASSTPNAKKTF